MIRGFGGFALPRLIDNDFIKCLFKDNIHQMILCFFNILCNICEYDILNI